jgi:hypothetical protein
MHFRRKRAKAVAVRHVLCSERHRHQGAPVEAVAKPHDGSAFGCIASDLHCVLDGFSPRVREHRLLVVVAGSYPVERLCQLHVTLVHRDVEALMKEFLDLIVDRREHARIAPADVQHAEATGEVDELIAVDIGHFRPVAGRHEYGSRVEDGSGHGSIAALAEVS